MEALSKMMHNVVLARHIKGLKGAVGGVGTVLIAYLLFAVDTLVFYVADVMHLDYLGQVLT